MPGGRGNIAENRLSTSSPWTARIGGSGKRLQALLGRLIKIIAAITVVPFPQRSMRRITHWSQAGTKLKNQPADLPPRRFGPMARKRRMETAQAVTIGALRCPWNRPPVWGICRKCATG
jgi:hypothetical protein